MRRMILFAVLVAAPSLVAAYIFNKQEVVVEVGRTDKSVRFGEGSFGMGGNSESEHLHSADKRIAVVYRFPDNHLEITGISPGDTVIPRSSGGYYVRIHVICGTELPVRAEQAVIAARAGEAVQLRAVSEIAQRTTFQWYAGRIGDVSQPLATGGMELTFIPSTSPKQYVWVSATTACSVSAAELEINVPPARNRAVRH